MHTKFIVPDDENYLPYLQQKAEDYGVTFRFDTPLVKLLKDNDKVVGAIVGSEDNGYIQVNAKKGVVLACGGYANDPELLQKLNPVGQETVVLDTSQAGDTGDAIKAGIWAGGFKDAVASAMVFDRAIGNPGIKGGYPYEGSGFFMNFGSQPFLRVTYNGKRFCNEFYPTSEQRGYQTTFMSRKTKYAVCDNNFTEYRQYTLPQHAGFNATEENIAALRESLDKAYAKFKGTYEEPEQTEGEGGPGGHGPMTEVEFIADDTLEGLAGQLGLTGDAAAEFVAQIERYNGYCEAGADAEFGRAAEVLFPVKDGPFYACTFDPVLGETMVTMGGIITDGDMNALDANYEPIPGLYMAGNDCGRRFGTEYITPIPGVSLAFALVLGRECGKSVAKFLG